MLLNAWIADYPDPDSFLRVGLRMFPTGWHHERYDRLVSQAGRVEAQAERLELYREADRILVEQAAVEEAFHRTGAAGRSLSGGGVEHERGGTGLRRQRFLVDAALLSICGTRRKNGWNLVQIGVESR